MGINEADIQAEMAKAEVKVANWAKRKRYWGREKRWDGDQFRSRNEITDELPPLNTVQRVFMLTWREDGKPIVVRQGDSEEPWSIPTVERDATASSDDTFSAETAGNREMLDAWLKDAASELWGIQVADWYQAARVHLTATENATDAEAGDERFFLFLCATSSGTKDIPEGAEWSRRSITTKDFVAILREHYIEFDEFLDQVHDGYLIRQAQA
ncbi:MAG TPA: hypothetical protein QGF05_09275 [Dehalococcoidia bacterium]|nr:hypothetical protein [Dehalococcoidia bacterium]